MGTVASASGTGDLRPSAKRKFLSDNLRDVIRNFVEDGLGDDEPPPQYETLSFTTLVM
jgi:hypothetical protein